MDKIKQYKNLNEQVSKLLRKTAPSDLNEEVAVAAQELVETLEDPAKLAVLMRTGLVQQNHISRVRNALKDPDKAMKNASIRSDLINMLMTLINVITANPSAFASVRKGVKGATALAAEGESSLIGEGAVKASMEDWLSDLPKAVISEIKKKYGKILAAANKPPYTTVFSADVKNGIGEILMANKVKPLMGSHKESVAAITMSFDTYHGAVNESKAGGIYDDSDDEDDTTSKGSKTRKGGKISKGGVYDHVPQRTIKGRLGKGRPAGAGASGFSEVYSRICEKAKMNIDEMDEMDENEDEVLSPKQKQLDVNKNNKIDAEDLRTLRSRKN